MMLLSLPLLCFAAAATTTAAATGNIQNLCEPSPTLTLHAPRLCPKLTVFPLQVSVLGPTGTPFFRNGNPSTPGAPENHIPIREYFFAATSNVARAARPPITVIRTIDNASPLLMTAYINNNILREVSILSLFDVMFNGQQVSGKNWSFRFQRSCLQKGSQLGLKFANDSLISAGYNQVLSNARVAGIEVHATSEGVLEKLTFSYDKLLSYYSDGNSSTIANWG
jgi:type VI protein secretion system component Hcp